MRSHLCGRVSEALDGRTVTLCGWVAAAAISADWSSSACAITPGIVQVVVEPDNPDGFAVAETLRNEYCVKITGTVRMRPESQWNAEMKTGKVEVVADRLEMLNASAALPLLMTDEDGEEVRLKYRYLDLRRPPAA